VTQRIKRGSEGALGGEEKVKKKKQLKKKGKKKSDHIAQVKRGGK